MDFPYLSGAISDLGIARIGGSAQWWLAGGILTAECDLAYQPKGALDYAASKINLNSPGVLDASDGIAPPWSAAGWSPTGSQYLYVALPKILSQTRSFFVRFTSAGSGEIFGRGSNTGFPLTCSPGGSAGYYGSSVTFAPMSSGSLMIAGTKLYINGIDSGGTFGYSSPVDIYVNLAILARFTYVGGLVGYFTGTLTHFAAYNTIRSAAQAASLHAETEP